MLAMEILGGSLLPTSEMDKGKDGSFNSTKGFNLRNADSTVLGYSRASWEPKLQFHNSMNLFAVDFRDDSRPADIMTSNFARLGVSWGTVDCRRAAMAIASERH
jgi:hypothetical protein